MSAHPISDGDIRPRSPQFEVPSADGSFAEDDLAMNTARLTAPYHVQSSTVADLPPEPVVVDEEKTRSEGQHEEGGEARDE